MENKKALKLGAAVLGGAVLLLGGAGIGANTVEPEQVLVNNTVYKDKIEYRDTQATIDYVKELEQANKELAEDVKELKVGSEELDLVLDHLYDNDGDVEYLTEDLDDDEVQKIVDRVHFIDDVKKLAVDYVKKEGIDELDRRDVNGTELDEDDIERFKVYDWDEKETKVDEVDFDDGDAEVLVEARFEHDDVDYKAVFRVEFEEGEVDDIRVESIELR